MEEFSLQKKSCILWENTFYDEIGQQKNKVNDDTKRAKNSLLKTKNIQRTWIFLFNIQSKFCFVKGLVFSAKELKILPIISKTEGTDPLSKK